MCNDAYISKIIGMINSLYEFSIIVYRLKKLLFTKFYIHKIIVKKCNANKLKGEKKCFNTIGICVIYIYIFLKIF